MDSKIDTDRVQEFILRVKKKGEIEYFIGRRYGDFAKLHKSLRTELPGKILPPLPKKNKQSSTASNLMGSVMGRNNDSSDDASISSVSTRGTQGTEASMRNLTVKDHRRSQSGGMSLGSITPRSSMDGRNSMNSSRPRTPATPGSTGTEVIYPLPFRTIYFRNRTCRNHEYDSDTDTDPEQPVILWRENQRISLRAFLRTLLSQPQIANTKAMQEFLTADQIQLEDAAVEDIAQRKAMDEKRVEEQKQFYEIARKRAADLDVYMEQYVLDASLSAVYMY